MTIDFGGKQATVLFAGLAPGWVGLYQVNFQVPADGPSGTSALVVSTKDGSSQTGIRAEAVPTADLGGGVKMEFVYIPAGEFMMGCSPGDTECGPDEKPQRRTQISEYFELGKFEVTQAQWEAVMGNNPSNFKDADLPVENVEIGNFLTKLNQRNDGYFYRIPAEAEWVVCRARRNHRRALRRSE